MNPLKAENRKGEREHLGRQVHERMRAGRREDETPKRDRPETGRPGQRELSQ
jgi:hypothetical protein